MANTAWSSSYLQGSLTLTGSNLIVTSSSGTGSVHSPDIQNSGLFYFEATYNVRANTNTSVGLADESQQYAALASLSHCIVVNSGGTIYFNGTNVGSVGTALVNGDVICFAINLNMNRFWARKNASGNWNNSATANPAQGFGGISFAGLSFVAPYAQLGATSEQVTLNAGDSAFTGTVPTGYTSGWPTTSIGGSASFTQVGAEIWSAGSPSDARFTQVGIEVWSQTANISSSAFFTQVGMEIWASTSNVVPQTSHGAILLVGV